MFKFKSKSLVTELQRRAQTLAGRRVSATVVVPPDMGKWISAQEFGTTGPYEIPGPLVLPPTAEYPHPTLLGSTMHPGVSPKSFIRAVLPQIDEVAASEMTAALVNNQFDPSAAQEALVTKVMPDVINKVADSMAEQLHQHRTTEFPGKLGVEEPSEAFRNAAQIESTGT